MSALDFVEFVINSTKVTCVYDYLPKEFVKIQIMCNGYLPRTLLLGDSGLFVGGSTKEAWCNFSMVDLKSCKGIPLWSIGWPVEST